MGEMLGWQELGDNWRCDGVADEHSSTRRGARVWIEQGGACFCESCGKLRQVQSRRRECMAPECEKLIPKNMPATQATCSRACGQRLRAVNAAAAESSREEPQDGAAAL